ncbi:MAG: lasso peptide biosynthesis B2 protein [Gammaproteobacteria bacterium]|nr:lasso peptide biosynthesis B2 protein [Gammaproteobacteria bacterium]
MRGAPVERGLFLSAWGQLGRAWWDLRRRPIKDLLAGLAPSNGKQRAPTVSARQLQTANDIGRALRAAAARTPWPSSCLVQVLAAQRMLSARGTGGILYIGADTMDEHGTAGFAAHAWLMCGNSFVTGEVGNERYTVVSDFRWEG